MTEIIAGLIALLLSQSGFCWYLVREFRAERECLLKALSKANNKILSKDIPSLAALNDMDGPWSGSTSRRRTDADEARIAGMV